MRSLNSNLVLVSAYSSKLSNEQNSANHQKAVEMLNRDNVTFQVVIGVYKGSRELTFLMDTTDANQHNDNVTTAYMLAHLFNQESILEVHNDRVSILHFIGGESQTLGTFTEVSQNEAFENDSYTYEPVSDRYFIVK